MTWDIFDDSMPELLVAAIGTLRMTAFAFLLAAALGLALAFLRLAGGLAGRLALLYIEIVRGMPALTLLFLIYFGLVPAGIVLNSFLAAVVALGLNGAAYLAEVYRAGIQAVDSGQREAAQMLGLRRASDDARCHSAAGSAHRAAADGQLSGVAVEGHLDRVADFGARTDVALTRSGRDILPADGVLSACGSDVFGHGMANDVWGAPAGTPLRARSACREAGHERTGSSETGRCSRDRVRRTRRRHRLSPRPRPACLWRCSTRPTSRRRRPREPPASAASFGRIRR